MPTKAPLHPWEWVTARWQRLHIDYAGPFQNSMFLVVVDAHSKWPEVIPVSSTTTSKTIEVLRDLFARFGIPEQIVSDNGPQFVSEEFQAFIKSNGIRPITSAPYHPATNGLAERLVQTFKQALRAMFQSSKPVKEKLAKFFIAYRNTPHSTTGESPAQLLLGRPLRTRLSLVLFGSCIAHGMFPVKERLSSKSPKQQKEDFSLIHNKIGNPVANLLKYLSY